MYMNNCEYYKLITDSGCEMRLEPAPTSTECLFKLRSGAETEGSLIHGQQEGPFESLRGEVDPESSGCPLRV